MRLFPIKFFLLFQLATLSHAGLLANIDPDLADDRPVDPNPNYNLEATQSKPIPFVPFRVEEFCKHYFNNECTAYYRHRDEEITDKSMLTAFSSEGTHKGSQSIRTIGEYVDHLNAMEKIHNLSGETLRAKDHSADEEQAHAFHLPTDRERLKSQLLETLRVNTAAMLSGTLGLDPNASCPLLPVPEGNPESNRWMQTKINMKGILDLPYDDVIRRFNEQQQVLCSLGLNLFADLDLNKRIRPAQLIKKIMAIRDQIIENYDLSEYSTVFSMETVTKIESAVNITKTIQDIIEAKQFPSNEQLMDLRKDLNALLPDDYDIPDIPNFGPPVPPSRRKYELKKRKDWSGFNYGKRSIVATYAQAALDITGSEDVQNFTASGSAGLYILNNPFNVIGGYAEASAGPEQVYFEVNFQSFGQKIYAPKRVEGSVRIEDSKPNAWHLPKLDKSYRQYFTVGPVPIKVTLGAYIDIGVGYEYGIYNTQVKASVIPYAKAAGYAHAEAGIPEILTIGAGFEMTIIDARIPLTAYAAIKFDEVGYPFLSLGLDGRVQYQLVNGKVYAFVKYLVPRLGLPPWKRKTSTYELFKWSGYSGDQKIMNWQLELGRNGTRLEGDLLDQTDREEEQALANAVLLDNRRRAVYEYHKTVQDKLTRIFTGILPPSGEAFEGSPEFKVLSFRGFLTSKLDQTANKLAITDDVVQKLFDDIIADAS